MTKPYVMRLARPDELDTVISLLDERIQWLRDRGSDQWSTGRTFRTRLRNSISRKETWLLLDGGVAIGTVSISTDGDPDFWQPEELAERAIYVGKMATRVERSGQGLGALMIQWAQDYAARAGIGRVRWDVWRTNKQLQDYYRGLGAKHVRTVEDAERWSGALFEVPSRHVPELPKAVRMD